MGWGKNSEFFEARRPNKLLQAAAYLQDEALTKIANLEEKSSLFDADLHYYTNWQVAQVIYFCDTTLLIRMQEFEFYSMSWACRGV